MRARAQLICCPKIRNCPVVGTYRSIFFGPFTYLHAVCKEVDRIAKAFLGRIKIAGDQGSKERMRKQCQKLHPLRAVSRDLMSRCQHASLPETSVATHYPCDVESDDGHFHGPNVLHPPYGVEGQTYRLQHKLHLRHRQRPCVEGPVRVEGDRLPTLKQSASAEATPELMQESMQHAPAAFEQCKGLQFGGRHMITETVSLNLTHPSHLPNITYAEPARTCISMRDWSIVSETKHGLMK
mmetsp:Transcript_10905/g.21207  ORF Transcript_10905/g.21207 Transcript_10905/m.21207 type:complete len:239 (-) Transcript_10905:186-902(-)